MHHHPRNWILLRGLARGIGHWGAFAQKIQEHFPNDKFEFIDLPGNGSRNQETSPLKISDYVKDLRAHSQFVKNKEKFNILAVSLGAMITVEWMREFPLEVQRAYLICTSSNGLSPFYHRFQPINLWKGLPLLTAHSKAELWEKTILGMITNNQERRESEILAMIAYSERYPVRLENLARQMTAASQYRFPKEAPGDIRLLGSYGDRLVSSNCTLSIGKAWGLKPEMHSWAGHDLPIDDPQWLLEHLL